MPSTNLIQIASIGKNIKIKKSGKKLSNAQILKNIGVAFKFQTLADDALSFMKTYIMSKAKHPSGNLAEALDVTIKETPKGILVGLGNIRKLNEKAPYWYVLNYGKTTSGAKFIPPAFIGSFEGSRPDAERAGTQNVTKGKRQYYIVPTKFTPINYIEATLSYLKNRMKQTSRSTRGFTRASLPKV